MPEDNIHDMLGTAAAAPKKQRPSSGKKGLNRLDTFKLKEPDAHMILPEVISKEPLGPVVRHGDDKWLDAVKWTLYAMVEAEELGVTSKNVDQMKSKMNLGPSHNSNSALNSVSAASAAKPNTALGAHNQLGNFNSQSCNSLSSHRNY